MEAEKAEKVAGAGDRGQLQLVADQSPSGRTAAGILGAQQHGDDSFDWADPDNPDVAIPTQGAIAVYVNNGGCVTIRQEALWNEEADSIVYVHPLNIDALIARLEAVKAQVGSGKSTARG
jgi:hypothetical protein